jgi:hypothetical protein
MQTPQPHSHFVRNLYFLIGIIATLAYRVIVAVDNRSAVQVLWYIGTIGFIIYFLHRYQISETRSQLIKEHRLQEKAQGHGEFNDDDKASMSYIFKTLSSTKEKWNSVVIFVSSGVALLLGLYLDFLR